MSGAHGDSAAYFEYYSSQLALPQVGRAGQSALRAAHVVVVGAGGLAAGVLPALAGAGVGRFTLVDGDTVERSNLHRQTIYDAAQLGCRKVECAAQLVLRINPAAAVVAVREMLTADNVLALFRDADLVLDCTDNLPARLLVSDGAELATKPVISGSSIRMQGQILLYGPQRGSYRSLLGSQRDRVDACTSAACAEQGVLGPLPAFVGSFMANLACARLLRLPSPAFNFVTFDLCDAQQPFRFVALKPRLGESATTALQPSDYALASANVPELSWAALRALPATQLFDLRRDAPPLASSHARLPVADLDALLASAASQRDCTPLLARLGGAKHCAFYCYHGKTSAAAVAKLAAFCARAEREQFQCAAALCAKQLFSVRGGAAESDAVR